MPRNLGRLRFRAPKPIKPLNIARIPLENRRAIERELREHAYSVSKPVKALSLQTVVDPRWKQQPGKKTRKLTYKPHTLRDLVDPQARRQHGEIIYIFRNIRTNQVIYSLSELLDNYHLDQLPFIGKHSKPPTLRPDEWAPHCVVTFPTAAQGHHAFRKLREWRKLHETLWNHTNPEWIKLPIEKRIKRIMDQVAFTTADLAAVLAKQDEQAGLMQKSVEEQEQQTSEYMEKKWPEIQALAEASLAKEKRDGDNTKWLEWQIKRMDYQLKMKNNQNEKDQKRLQTAKRSHEVRLKKILYAQRKSELLKAAEQKLEKKAAPAMEIGAAGQLESLKSEVSLLMKEVAHPSPERTEEEIAFDKATINSNRKQISKLEKAFRAKEALETRNHLAARSIIPRLLQKELPKPFTMDVEIKWADLRDPEWAKGKWPPTIVHDVLPLRAQKESVQFLNAAEYHATVEGEVTDIVNEMERKAREEEEAEQRRPGEEGKITNFLSVRNPFKKRAEV